MAKIKVTAERLHAVEAERDQLRQQVALLLSRVDAIRSGPASGPRRWRLEDNLYLAVDQVRKELGDG